MDNTVFLAASGQALVIPGREEEGGKGRKREAKGEKVKIKSPVIAWNPLPARRPGITDTIAPLFPSPLTTIRRSSNHESTYRNVISFTRSYRRSYQTGRMLHGIESLIAVKKVLSNRKKKDASSLFRPTANIGV